MRKINKFCSLFFLVLMAGNMEAVAGEKKESKESFSFERVIKPETQIIFENKIGKLKVETWDKNSVKADIYVTIDGEADQVEKVLGVIRKMNFTEEGDKVSFNTRFYTTMSGMIPGKFSVTLPDCSAAKLRKLDVSFVLTMPRGNAFALVQSYEDATLPDLDGNVTLNLYECDLTAGNLPNCNQIISKFGKTGIDSVKDVSITIYEGKLMLHYAGSVKMISKYSSVEIGQMGSLTLESYEDKIHALSHGDLSVNAKYSDFQLADFNTGTFNLYECELKAGNGNIVALTAKYSTMEFLSCRAIVFTSGHENKFSCAQVGDLKASSKYCSYKITRLEGNMLFTASYEDKINVLQVHKNFKGIEISGKYAKVDLLFDKGASYKLNLNLKYTSLDYPKASFREIRYHKEDDHFEYLGVTAGGDENALPVVKMEMVEGGIRIK